MMRFFKKFKYKVVEVFTFSMEFCDGRSLTSMVFLKENGFGKRRISAAGNLEHEALVEFDVYREIIGWQKGLVSYQELIAYAKRVNGTKPKGLEDNVIPFRPK